MNNNTNTDTNTDTNTNTNINKNILIIDELYRKATYSSRYGLDIFITIILVITVCGFISYFAILNHLQALRTNWATEKCKPYNLPFVNIINPDPNLTAEEQIRENINECLKEGVNDMTSGTIGDIFNKLFSFNDIKSDFDKFGQFIQSLFIWFNNTIAYGINLILSVLQKTFLGLTQIFLKVETLFNRFLGVLLTNFFAFIQMFNMAIAFILNFTSILNILILIPLSITVTILASIVTVLTLLMQIPFVGWFLSIVILPILIPLTIALAATIVLMIISTTVMGGLITIQNTAQRFISPSLNIPNNQPLSPQFSNRDKPPGIDQQIKDWLTGQSGKPILDKSMQEIKETPSVRTRKTRNLLRSINNPTTEPTTEPTTDSDGVTSNVDDST